MNSFHAWMKAKIPVATRPGATSGSVMRMNAPIRLAPSTIAASSSSNGTPATKPRSVQIVNGRTNTRYVSASPITVFVRWRPSRMRNSEMISASAGIICTISTVTRNAMRPRNRKRASATAARNATTSASTTTTAVTIALLRSDVQK